MKDIIWDNFRMILQTGDGGDTAANMGTYHIFAETRRRMGHKVFCDGLYQWREKIDFAEALRKLESPTKKGRGLYRRHPDSTFWGSRINTMSRDQTIPLLGAMALYGMKGKVLEYIFGHFLRAFLFTTNTTANWSMPADAPKDWGWFKRLRFFFGWRPGYPVYATKLPDFTDPEFWALELRGLYHWATWPLLFPLLCVLDLQTLLGSYNKVYRYAKDPSHSDDRNHVNVMLVGLQVCPTPVMKFAAKVYSKRPRAEIPAGTYQIPGAPPSDYVFPTFPSGPQSALDHYYRAENSPPFNVMAQPIVKEFFQ